MSGITFGGLSSGIDTSGIIDKLMSLESRPIQTYQKRLGAIQTEQNVLSAFKSQLQSMSSAALSLNAPLAFNPIKATTSDAAVATINATTGATAGIYTLKVSRIAQAQKVSSTPQTDTTSALNQSGSFVVNGKVVKVTATDSLQKIAQNINSAGAGVTASLIDGGAGRAYLTLTANSTGLKNKIQMTDASGSVLSNLGIVSGAATARETVTNGVTSANFSSSSKTLAELFPDSGLTTATFKVNGADVNVDFATDTLTTLATKISTTGANASVRTVTENGASTYKLDIISTVGGDTFTDDQNVLQMLGVLQKAPGSELVAAKDAKFTLDNVEMTSATNSITTAIPGATITLLKGDETTPVSTTLTLAKDVDAIKTKVKAFTDGYNGVIDFVNQYSQFDKDTFESGPLFGNPVARQIVSQVSSLIFSNMPGAIGNYKNLASLGFDMDDKGKITVDDTKLANAINTAPDAVNNLFQTVGTSTGTNLTYISAGNLTRSGTYNVEITALATKGSFTAGVAQTNPTATTETLTFGGTLFGSSQVMLTIPQNTDHQGIIDLINNDTRLSSLLQASDDNGKLKITSKREGNAGNFTVTSDLPNAGGDTSGIGSATDGLAITGTDMQGKINGEPASGTSNGMLVGNTGNATTSGLQVQYTGTTTGVIGTVTVNKAMSAMITDMVAGFTDPVNGLLTGRDQALTAQQKDINNSITRLQTRISKLQGELQIKFAAMEQAISQLQSQGSQMLAGLKSTSSN